jgi:rare lipoprotein A (peptidoglycan hydrolase)
MGAVKSWEEDDVNPGEARPSSGTATLFATSLLVLSMVTLPACMTVPKGRGSYDTGYMERGYASWYGGYFHGRPTASGAIFNQFEMTAAHRLLPLGSVVRVTNPENGRNVVVVINDRGPFIKGRVIDLSYAAAKQLSAVKPGTFPVLIEVIQMGSRSTTSSLMHMTGLDQKDDVAVGGRALQVTQIGDPHDDNAWLSEIEGLARRAARGPRDVLRAPPRSRKSTV